MLSILPAIQSFELQYENLKLNNRVKDRIPILKQMGPVGTYEDYIKNRENKPLFIQKISDTIKRTNLPTVIIFVEADIFSELNDEIVLYNETLNIVGYDTVLYKVSGLAPKDLKDIIISYWQSGLNVSGTVLIGDLPVEWFHHENDFSGPAEFPCDLYLMDLDGTWTDTDSDGMFDSHTDGSGDTAPEIYAGRIDASNIPGDEIFILKKYFSKVNDFWLGETQQTDIGLTYTDQDWAGYESFRYDLQYAYEALDAIWYPDVDRDDYVNNRIPDTYEFIQLSCHSSSQGHAFTTGGWASNYDIRNAPPNALFYNLFCCSSLRFTDYNCLGYAYILDTNTPSLLVIGSSKTGSMLDFRYFYEPVGHGSSFGTALKKWFEYVYPYGDEPGGYNDISWFYGMTILGDPTIIKNKPPYETDPPEKPTISGPSKGTIGLPLDFTVTSTDPNDNDIYFMIIWGDGSYTDYLGPYSSGEEATFSHVWSSVGKFNIIVKAKDQYGAKSPQNSHKLSITKNKLSSNPFMLRLQDYLLKNIN